MGSGLEADELLGALGRLRQLADGAARGAVALRSLDYGGADCCVRGAAREPAPAAAQHLHAHARVLEEEASIGGTGVSVMVHIRLPQHGTWPLLVGAFGTTKSAPGLRSSSPASSPSALTCA